MALVKNWPQHIEVMEADDHIRPLDEVLADVMAIAIDHYGGNVAAAAEYLGLARTTVYNFIKRNRLRDALGGAYPN